MKNRLFNAFLLLALVGTMLASCKKEYPQPPIQNLPIGTVYTIQDILNMSPGTVFDTASVYGIVTADEVSGNLYKMCFIQDRATGAAIELKLNSTSGVRIGDSIRVYLKDVLLEKYHNLPQLSGFGPDGHIIILANNRPIEPAITTIAGIKAGQYLCRLVRLEDVQFTQTGTFAESSESGNRYLVDATSPNNDDNFVVRTSNYANFAYDNLPEGPGSMVAIATIYNSTWQLIIRSKNEMEFENWDPTPTPPAVPGEVQSLPYTQLFSTGFGTYMSYSVIDDNHVWSYESSYSVVQMTGHVGGNPGENYANEDWLISSPVALTGVTDAKMTMKYLGRYFDNINNDVTVWVSNNYTYGENPTTAQWTQLPANLVESSSWSDFKDIELALTDFIGQTVTVAVKYLSTDTKGGTIEVSAITVEEGTAGGDTPPGPGPGEGEGSGTADDPYNVAAGISQQTTQETAWVRGYIVGAVKSGDAHNSVTSNDDIDWAAPFGRATNVLIADDASCNDIASCLIVKMPSGSALRTNVNLVDHPDNLGKELLVYGTLKYGFGQPGVDSPGTESDFVLEGGDTPTPPGPGTTEYFNQTLTTQASFNTFSAYSVTGDQEWYQNSSHLEYGAVMSGFANSTSYANEDWFISPVIDLSASTNPILTFDHARGPQDSMNVGVEEGYYTVWVTNDYPDGADPSQERWVELPILNQPTVKWQFVSAGDLVIPEAFKTATCRIAFRYLSVAGASATWEIKNVVVKEQ